MKRSLLFILLCSLFTFAFSKENTVVVFPNEVHQTIHSFGASDCWRTQYIGKNWPLEKRNAIADYLFSSDFDDKGSDQFWIEMRYAEVLLNLAKSLGAFLFEDK